MDAKRLQGLAALAEASYSNFINKKTNEVYSGHQEKDIIDALQKDGDGFSPSQAEAFIKQWRLAEHQPDTNSGFSASLFQSIENPDQYVYGLRGTNGIVDFFDTDIGDIVFDGLAIDQIVDMYNDWQRLNTPEGTSYKAATLETQLKETLLLKSPAGAAALPYLSMQEDLIIDMGNMLVRKVKFQDSDTLFDDRRMYGSGALTGDESITATGHSLGGHLASAFSRLFPELNADSLSVNGAGFGNNFNRSFFNQLRPDLPLPTSFNPDLHNSVFGERGLEMTAQDGVTLFQPGEHTPIFIEDASPSSQLGHSASQMTDSLAVYDLFIQLSKELSEAAPRETLEYLTSIFESASNTLEHTYESLVTSLHELFLPDSDTPNIKIDDRENLHAGINAIRSSEAYKASVGKLEIVTPADLQEMSLSAEASNNSPDAIAYRYALLQLNPFILTGLPDLYHPHNANGELALYGAVNNTGQLTAEYIEDRALFLNTKNEAFRDKTINLFNTIDSTHLTDLATALGLRRLTGIDSHAEESLLIFDDVLDGQLKGNGAADSLYGAGGNDVLEGRKGNDYLEGGNGFDTYIYNDGDGQDVIRDHDASGQILLNNSELSGGFATDENIWLDQESGISYVLERQDDGSDDLIINGTLRVKNFRNGDLGISLDDNPPEPLNPDITGSDNHDRLYSEKYYEADNKISGLAGHDNLLGGPGNDTLDGGEGNDWLYAHAGDDTIVGSGGNDAIFTGQGNDHVAAGAGNDLVLATEDVASHAYPESIFPYSNDIWPEQNTWRLGSSKLGFKIVDGTTLSEDNLHQEFLVQYFYDPSYEHAEIAGTTFTYEYDTSGSQSAFLDISSTHSSDTYRLILDIKHTPVIDDSPKHLNGGQGNDLLAGNAGDDMLIGGAGFDRIAGNKGNDILFGGLDDDALIGGSGNDQLHGEDGNDWLLGEDGNDVILGGQGDDELYGDNNHIPLEMSGNDILNGGEGHDIIHGQGGDDEITGGTGNDTLLGGKGEDSFHFHLGDGIDIIEDIDKSDSLHFQHVDHTQVSSKLVTTTDNQKYLSITYGSEDIVYLKNGLETGLSFINLNGIVMPGPEFVNQTLTDAITYQLTKQGAVFGGSHNDTLIGSLGNDQIHAQDGNDILAGNAGDDILHGGSGKDEYRIGPGTGRDLIYDNSSDGNALRLLGSLSINDISYLREGDDLLVQTGKGRDGAVLKDFFSQEGNWNIHDASGQTFSLNKDTVSLDIELTTRLDINTLWQDFLTNTISYYEGLLTIQGYTGNADGSFIFERTPNTFRGTTYQSSYTANVVTIPESSNASEYIRSIPDTISTKSDTYIKGNYTMQWNTQNAIYVAGNPDNQDIIDPNMLSSNGISGISLDGTRIPVYSDTPDYNPLTGEVSANVKGFWIFPEGEKTWSQSFYQKINYSEYDVMANILELNGGAASQELLINNGQFNLVDAGDGNDIIDARNPHGDISKDNPGAYLEGLRIKLPYGSGPTTHSAPGSLLYGNTGDDQLFGSASEDILIGGSGYDFLAGGPGDDRYYLLNSQAGDIIFDDGWSGNNNGYNDVVFLPQGIGLDDISWTYSTVVADGLYPGAEWWGRTGSAHTALHFHWKGSDGIQVILPHTDLGNSTGIDFLELSNGERLALKDITDSNSITPNPHDEDNIIVSPSTLYGGKGNDILIAQTSGDSRQNNFLVGGAGADVIIGSDTGEQLFGGNIQHDWSMDFLRTISTLEDEGNIFQSGAGNDTIWGGSGSDTFRFYIGDGQDSVTDFLHDHAYLSGQKDLSAHEKLLLTHLGGDVLHFGPSIAAEDITLQRSDDDLLFQHRNDSDSIRFLNWFNSDHNALSKVTFSDGSYWSIDQITDHLETGKPLSAIQDYSQPTDSETVNIDLLIDAIAAFNPPEGADSYVINPNMDTMMGMLASGWQPSDNPAL